VFERFFDEAGGMQLVIHSPFGSRINRAWGLALRKRFCRKFNFELQAAATEDNIVLSLTTTHSFELEEMARYLHSTNVRSLLIQALLDAPMFATRWRWVAGVALALPRFRGGRKVAPQLARMEAEGLVAAVFPDQMACGENIAGDREIPDHPMTNQTISDGLHEAMDIEGLEKLLARLEAGEIRVVARDLTQPSPLADREAPAAAARAMLQHQLAVAGAVEERGAARIQDGHRFAGGLGHRAFPPSRLRPCYQSCRPMAPGRPLRAWRRRSYAAVNARPGTNRGDRA
jgi:Lhr-like helicase